MSNNTQNAVVKQESQPIIKQTPIRDLLEKQKSQIALALPKHLTPDRFMRVALTVINKNPKLQECTSTSLLACIMDCAQLGLEPDGRRAHLIPFRDNKNNRTNCTLLIDYKGLVELVMNSGDVSSIHADVVCENDDFEYNMGEIVRHRIDFKNPRGNAFAAYCLITMKDGSKKAEVMTQDQLNKIRDRSQGYISAKKFQKDHPWISDWDEMAKKTVFRRASKWVKLSPEAMDKVTADDNDFSQVTSIAKSVNLVPETPKLIENAEEPPITIEEPKKTETDSAPTQEKSPIQSGEKTARITKVLDAHGIPHDKALNYFGDFGCSNFEEVNERKIEQLEKNPENFKRACGL